MFSNRLINFGRQLLTAGPLQNTIQTLRNRSILANKIEFLKTPNVDKNICKDVFGAINQKINNESEGRLFAVVHLCGKQFKVTAGDIIVIEGYWAPTIGDKLRLEKVLLVGGEEFSLIGRPLVQAGLVDVQATVIEKSIAHTRTNFKKKRRKQYTNIKFQRSANSMIRINSITLNGNVNENLGSMPGQHIFQ